MLRTLILLLTLGCTSLLAQFYATPTPLHDVGQRNFPIEAARVLAWLVNQNGGEIRRITWEVDSKLLGPSVWKIRFLGPSEKNLHEAEIRYDDAGLTSGPAWHRSIVDTLMASLPALKLNGDAAADLDRFWKAGEGLGASRAESLRHALEWLEEHDSATVGHAAQLAGMLTHAALPSMSGNITLDGLLLARAAVWLTLAEKAAGQPFDAAWCPLMFLAGREQQAVKLWPAKTKVTAESPIALQWWHHTLTHPLAKDAFIFAGDPARIDLAVPFLARFARLESTCGSALLEVLAAMGGKDAMQRLHDYGPLMVDSAGVGGGHFASSAAYHARREWLSTLSLVAGQRGDPGFIEQVDQARQSVDDAEVDPSLTGLAATKDLLREGYESHDYVAPVALVTLDDLLVFGYDNTLLQMVARYNMVAKKWGVPEQAKEIHRVVKPVLPAFDSCSGQEGSRKTSEKLRPERFEHFDWYSIQRWGYPGYNEALKQQPVERSARLWLRHNYGNIAVLWHLAFGPKPKPQLNLLIKRLEAEGGEQALKMLDQFLRDEAPSPMRNRYTGDAAWQQRLEKLTPNNISARLSRIASSRELHENPLELAQRMEKQFWQIPDSGRPSTIFLLYLEAGAFDAARRFYDQAYEVSTESVGFSNDMANRRWTLAMIEENAADMEKHRSDASTYSYSDITKTFMQELAAGDDDEALRVLLGGIERYESDDAPEHANFKRMRDFMPLIPALKDPAHPRHAEALRFFHRDDDWPTAQWVLIQRCKLSPADAERFLGGEFTNPERLCLIAYLRQDRELFDAAFARTQQTKIGDMARVVTLWLRGKLHGIAPPENQPDLRPSDALPLHELTLRGLKKR